MAKLLTQTAIGLALLGMMCCAAGEDNAGPMAVQPVLNTPIGRRVFDDLATYYAARAAEKEASGIIPYQEMAKRLSSKDQARRQEAGDYLYALCLQAATDDRIGRTPRPRGIKLHGGPNYYGEELCGWVAGKLAQTTFYGNGKEAFHVAHWLYANDRWSDHREDVVTALTRIRTREADKLFCEIITNDEGNFAILSIALKQAAARKLADTISKIRSLCRHYHPQVREEALATATALGLKNIARYNPRADLSPRIEKWLRAVLTAMPDKVPDDANWCRFTWPDHWYEDDSDEVKTMEVCGWLVGEDDENYHVIDWTGQPRTWSRKETKVQVDSLSDFSKRVVTIREKFNATEDTDEKDVLKWKMGIVTAMTSSHSTWYGSIPEVLAAAWSFQRGDRQTSVRLIVPLMREINDEQAFLEAMRDEIAVKIDYRMLAAFTGREYDDALRIAEILSGTWFDGFYHQDRAKGLAKTLPSRRDDFKSLTLTSPQAWKALKKKLSRPRQIEYLGRRLRLIQASQWSIPGGIWYSDAQHLVEDVAESPQTSDESPAFPVGKEAINPYNELLRMNLTGTDLLLLIPFLESPDYILAYSLRRFIPNNPYHLHKVSWVAAAVIGTVAQEDLVDFDLLNGPSKEVRKHHLEEIRQWCMKNAAATHADHLAQVIENEKRWQDVRMAFWGLLELDEERAVKLIVARSKNDAQHKSSLAKLLCLLDRKDYLPLAREWVQDPNAEIRFWSALLVLKHADPKKPEGLAVVLEYLAKDIKRYNQAGDDRPFGTDPADKIDAAVDTLLAIDDPRVKKFFTTYCGAKPYGHLYPSIETLQRLFSAGYKSAHDRVLYHLNDKTPGYDGPVSDNWLWWVSYWRYKNPPRYLYELSDERREKSYADMKQWLASQFKRIKSGKPSQVISQDIMAPWGDWKTYSSGWVRRL